MKEKYVSTMMSYESFVPVDLDHTTQGVFVKH